MEIATNAASSRKGSNRGGIKSSSDNPETGDRTAARKLIFNSLKRRCGVLGLSLVGALGYIGTILLIPQVVKRTVDDLILSGRIEKLGGYVLMLACLALARAVFGGVRKFNATKLGASVAIDLRARLYEHLQRLSFRYHDRIGHGQLMSRASSDVTMMETLISGSPFLLQSILQGVGGAVLLLVLQPSLGAAVVAVIALVAYMSAWLIRPIRFHSRRLQDLLGNFAQFISQRIQGIRVVKGHGLERVHRKAGHRLADEIRDWAVRLADHRARFMATFVVLPGSAMLVVLSLGGWLGLNNRITPGGLVAFMQYSGLLVAPVMTAAQQLSMWSLGSASAARIEEVLRAIPDVVSPLRPRPLPKGNGTVVFDQVTFGYETAMPVLDEFSLEIVPGGSVAFVGITGCGKSTVARLVPRFYDPWAGRVLLDGVSVNELSLNELRRAVSIVFEDTVVFTSSVKDNIALGLLTATDEQIRWAAELAQADSFIRELPEGYDTVLGEEGLSLSGGQRQSLAIARAILRNPRVLILDDATSAVDPVTDEAIWMGLKEVVRGRTTIIIAHRTETLALATKVVLMHRGKIIAVGAHDELLSLPVYQTALGLGEEVRAG